MENLGIILKKFRESRELTIIELAEKAGIGKGTVGDIETGKSNGSIKTLEKISQALKLNPIEREKLFTAFMPSDIRRKLSDSRIVYLNKKELSQYEKTINEASLFFNDENISEEDKQKLLMAMNEMFFTSKKINKEKYAKKTDKNKK